MNSIHIILMLHRNTHLFQVYSVKPRLSAERTSIIDLYFTDIYAFIRKIYKDDAELRLCSKTGSEVLDSFEATR